MLFTSKVIIDLFTYLFEKEVNSIKTNVKNNKNNKKINFTIFFIGIFLY